MKPLVIYHDNCTDGFGAAFAAWLKLGDDAEYLPMSYDKNMFVPPDRYVYVLDFSFPIETMNSLFAFSNKVVWLDHHKTAFEMWCGKYTPGMTHKDYAGDDGQHFIELDDNKSGAMLAWEYFHPDTEAPMLIKHIDDRDRWQFKLEGSKELHAWLSSIKPWSFKQWDEAGPIYKTSIAKMEPSVAPDSDYYAAFDQGTAILRAQDQNVAAMAKQERECRIAIKTEQYGCTSEPGMAVNASLHQSELGHVLAKKSGTYGLIWYVDAGGAVNCSLRSEGDYDVSAIAKAFGGGGHKNAAGFQTDINTLMGWLK